MQFDMTFRIHSPLIQELLPFLDFTGRERRERERKRQIVINIRTTHTNPSLWRIIPSHLFNESYPIHLNVYISSHPYTTRIFQSWWVSVGGDDGVA